VFYFPEPPLDQTTILLFFVIAGVSAFAGMAMAAIPCAFSVFMLSSLLPMVIWLLSFGEHPQYIMATITLVYLGILLLFSRQVYNAVRTSLVSTIQNRELSMEVNNANLRMRQYFECAPGCCFTLHRTREGTFSMPFASNGITPILGIDPVDVVESIDSLLSISYPDDIEHMLHALNQSVQTMAACKVELRIGDVAKGERWVALQCMPQTVECGAIQWHGSMFDISERKQAERALRENIGQITSLNRRMEESAFNLKIQAEELEASQEQIRLTEAWYRGILQSAPDGMLVVDDHGIITLVNAQLDRMFGYAEGELVGQPIEVLIPLDLRAGHVGKRDGFIGGHSNGLRLAGVVSNLRGRRKDGSEFAADIGLSRLPDVDGSLGTICAAIRDISAWQQMENALAAGEREFRTLVENVPDVVVRYDLDCRRIYVNPAWERVNEMSAQDVIGKSPLEIASKIEPMASEFEQMLREVMQTKRFSTMDIAWSNKSGECACFALNVIPEFDQGGEVVSVLTVARDISERKRMEEVLAVREHESRTLIENTPDTIARYNRDCVRTFANQALEVAFEGGASALLGKKPSEVPGGPQSEIYEEKLREVFVSGKGAEFELAWLDMNGQDVCSHIRLTPEFDASDAVTSVLAVGRDITELNAFRQKLNRMAFYDSLTSLPNRALFNDRLRQMLADAERHGQMVGVMLLDLDRFKAINDSLGHPAGDELLCETAARLTRCVRGYNTVARLGGDEFAILLPQVRSGEELGRVAQRILELFNEPFMLEGKEIFVSTSIGIAVYPDDSTGADDLIKQSDSAMYLAKRSGRNNFRFYSRDLTASAVERLSLESELRRAIERNELELYYQPKVSLVDFSVIGSEALLRWKNPLRGMVSPDQFIPITEDSGLIVEIGEWALREACRTACEWNGPGKPLHKVAINLSARQFQSGDLVETVFAVIEETACCPEWIELEITESLLLDEHGDVLEILQAFRTKGISLAIDDFGTGYSSLSYLARFPINTLKIDRSFIHAITTEPIRAELVKAIISIAHGLGQQVVAEGVETLEQAAYLQAHGCQIAQGYLFSKPLGKVAFESLQHTRSLPRP
jgi:diguanylate cyclase (GGDEF)-like protein/PAS domain S-box-containing protein